MTFALLATTAGVCFSMGWTARRVSHSRRDDELKRDVYETKSAIPQLESNLRNRDQRIAMLTTEGQALRDRLTQAEASISQKEMEIAKRDREIRLARSELQIVKDGSIGLGPEVIDDPMAEEAPAASSDAKLAPEMKRLEARYESLKKGLIQRDDKIAALEQQLAGGAGKKSHQILEGEIAELVANAETAQATIAARDASIRDLQSKLQQDVEQRELLEQLTKRRGDANRTLKENYAKLEAQLPKLMDTLKARGEIIAQRDATIARLDADLSRTRTEKAERETTIASLETKMSTQRDQIAQHLQNAQAQKARMHELEQRIDMLTHEIAETTKALQSTHATVRERDATIAGRDERVQAIEEKLREQGITVASMQKLLKDRDFKIDSLTSDQAALEAKLIAASEKLLGAESKFTDVNEKLIGAKEENAKLNVQAAALQRSVTKWEQRVEVLTQALSESGQAAQAAQAAAEAAARAKETQTHERDAAAEERELKLRESDGQLSELTATIAVLKQTVAARDEQIDALNADAAALRMQLAEASNNVTMSPSAAAAEPTHVEADAPPTLMPGDVPSPDADAQLIAISQRADRSERELNATARELKALRAQHAELETRCGSLDDLLRGKDATLGERARRIEDLQDQLIRLEQRVDERNQQIADLKRARDEGPSAATQNAAFAASRNPAINYGSNPKPI
jgi:chromosome segregation ATPase